jgi:hypothetical protein
MGTLLNLCHKYLDTHVYIINLFHFCFFAIPVIQRTTRMNLADGSLGTSYLNSCLDVFKYHILEIDIL